MIETKENQNENQVGISRYVMAIFLALTVGAFIQIMQGCATSKGDKGNDSGGEKSSESSGGGEKESKASDRNKEEDEVKLTSAERKNLVHSLSNSQLTSRTVNREKVAELAVKLENSAAGSGKRDKQVMESLLSAQRLSDAPISQVYGAARKLVALEVRKGVKADLSDDVKLELALSGLRSGKFAFAEYFLEQVKNSKDEKIKSGYFNTRGLIALYDGRVPEAVQYWRQAIQVDGGNDAALLNYGFISLKYGEFEAARDVLAKVDGDWFANSGLIVAQRFSSDPERTSKLCEDVFDKSPKHKPSLYNCALFEYQTKKNLAKAKSYMDKMVAAGGGGEAYDERALKLVNEWETETATEKARELKRKEADGNDKGESKGDEKGGKKNGDDKGKDEGKK